MGYVLGVDLGTTYTAAAVHRDDSVRVVELGNRAAAIPSVVLVKEDEDVLTGESATRRAITEPERVAREFKRRLGDPTPLLLGGRPYSAEQLQAKLLRSVVAQVSQREGSPPDRVAVTHPANWGPYKLDLLGQALRMADLQDPVLLTEPQAAAIHYASQERIEPGTLVAVYDLGGGTFDVAILRKTDVGFEILGQPEGIERLGGIDFDEAVFAHVARALGGSLEALDPDDPAVAGAVARLRQDCVDAKEALSGDTEASIPVVLPNVSTEVRITRQEFESLIRPTLADTINAMHRALRSADVDAGDLHAVLLVGGSSRIPLVSQLVGAELGRPVAVDAHPKYGVAMGAALAAMAAQSGHDTGSVAVDSPDEATEDPDAGMGDVVAATAAAAAVAAAQPEVDAATASAEPGTDAVTPSVAREPEPPAVPAEATPAPSEPAPAKPAASAPVVPAAAAVSSPERSAPAASGGGGKGKVVAAVGAGVAVVAVLGAVMLGGGGGGDGADAAADPTDAATATPSESVSDEPTDPATEPTEEPTPDPTPEETVDPNSAEARGIQDPDTVLWLTLTDVTVDEAGRYVVEYETTSYEALVGNGVGHVHFFWPLWEPGTVGSGGGAGADWAAWPGGSVANAPLDTDKYSVTGREAAEQLYGETITQICAIVANNDHTVHEPATAEERGHCIDLPDV